MAEIRGSLPVMRISIHAPHARSDGLGLAGTAWLVAISIHAPHARSDGRS